MEANLPKALKFCKKILPGWKGRKIHVRVSEHPKRLSSLWDGGSRDDWYGVEISSGKLVSLPVTSNPFGKPADDYQPQPGVALVEKSMFMGKDAGCTLHLHPADLASFSD